MKDSHLEKLIKSSNSIVIMSHQGPDPDAISCTSFVLNTLRFNFPDKKIHASIDSAHMEGLNEIVNTKEISTLDWAVAIEKYKPDLLIICDLGEFKLLSSNFSEEKMSKFRKSGMKVVIIDHHPKVEQYADLYINHFDSSCAETVYEVFIKELKLRKYPGYQNEVLLGIISDTGSFAWADKNPEHCFDTAKEIVLDGGSIDKIQSVINIKSLDTIHIHAEYLKNMESNGEYSYTYISDDFKNRFPEISDAEFTTANKQFTYTYLKYVGSAKWGFTVKPKGQKGDYSISFRAQVGVIDTSKIATHLNGNGHKGSSGGLIQAKSINEAIQIVKDVIEKHKEEAYANK